MQARLIDAISKLFIAHMKPSLDSAAAQQQPYPLPDAAAAGCSYSPEMQAHASFGTNGWHTPVLQLQPPDGGGAGLDSPAGLAACSQVVRGALRHNFATLVATVFSSVASDAAEGTTVDVIAAEQQCNVTGGGAAGESPPQMQAQQTVDGCGSDCKPISITVAISRALKVAIKYLCEHASAPATTPVPAVPERTNQPPPGCQDAGEILPRQAENYAADRGADAVTSSHSAALHVMQDHGPFSFGISPSVYTPVMDGASECNPLPMSTGQVNVLHEACPSATPQLATKPSTQHRAAHAVCVSRSFSNVSHALVDCIERAFDAAQHRWTDEEPGVLAGTPMYPKQHTPVPNHSAVVPSEVESVLALCGTLGEDFGGALPRDALSTKMSDWLTSTCVDQPSHAKMPREDAGTSPLLQLHSPLSPFGGFGGARSSGVVVTMMHAVPMAALCVSLDAAMKLPVGALSEEDPRRHIRTMWDLRAHLNATCCRILRSAHKTLLASTIDPSPVEAVQAVAAANAAICCAMVAVEASGSFTESQAHQHATLTTLQAFPEALQTLYDVSWRLPRPHTQLSMQNIMMQLTQNTSHCEMYNNLATVALEMFTTAPEGGVGPAGDTTALSQWLPVAMFAISSLTACAVAAATDHRSLPKNDCPQQSAPGAAKPFSGTAEQPAHDRLSQQQVSVVVAAALKLILRAIALPALTGKSGTKQSRGGASEQGAGDTQNAVSSQQWRAWLTVLLQFCLEVAASELQAPASAEDGSTGSDFETLQSVLLEVGNYLTSAKVRH